MDPKDAKISIGGKEYTLVESGGQKGGGVGIISLFLIIVLSIIIFGGEAIKDNNLTKAARNTVIEVTDKINLAQIDTGPDAGVWIQLDFTLTNTSKYTPEKISGDVIIKNSGGEIIFREQCVFYYNKNKHVGTDGNKDYFVYQFCIRNFSEEAQEVWNTDYENIEIWYELQRADFEEGYIVVKQKKIKPVLIKEAGVTYN